MKNKIDFGFIMLLSLVLLLFSACTQTNASETNKEVMVQEIEPNNDVMMEEKTEEIVEEPTSEQQNQETTNGVMMEKTSNDYMGQLLAGTTTPYLQFNQADYEKALADGKTILLNFYAEWCPSCRAESPVIEEAFDSLKTTEVVGFRVKYKDGESQFERDLAKQFGVAYQHTKVILKDGELALKSPETWSVERYLSEIEINI